MEIETTATALPSNTCNPFAVPAQTNEIIEKHVSELKNQGFPEKKIRKLLARSGGNHEVVKAFLEAQRNLKECTKASKSQKKEEKRQRKHEKSRKERGKEHKMARKRDSKIIDANATPDSQFLPLTTLDSWPKDIRRVYLDGNNMLFVLAPLRNMCIKRNMKGAEIILHSMARKFCEALHLEECVLYFDDTHIVKDEGAFKVRSAKPAYATTDIALVELAKTLDSKAVYVTSDRELINFLKEQKGIISRPKDWFNFVAKLSGSNDQLDTWAEKWTESITQSLDKLSM